MSRSDSNPESVTRLFPTFERDWRTRHWALWLREDLTLTVLRRIDADRLQRASAPDGVGFNRQWLLPHRADLRQIIDNGNVRSIKIYLRDCPPEMKPLCVWLWGRCADRFRLYGLTRYCRDSSPAVRGTVAKALRRLEAWAVLNEMAAAYPNDAAVQRYASAAEIRRPFSERLTNFKRDIDDSHAGEVFTPSRMPYWALDETWSYTPPKSVQLIRRMLRRIRHWVRWGVS